MSNEPRHDVPTAVAPANRPNRPVLTWLLRLVAGLILAVGLVVLVFPLDGRFQRAVRDIVDAGGMGSEVAVPLAAGVALGLVMVWRRIHYSVLLVAAAILAMCYGPPLLWTWTPPWVRPWSGHFLTTFGVLPLLVTGLLVGVALVRARRSDGPG